MRALIRTVPWNPVRYRWSQELAEQIETSGDAHQWAAGVCEAREDDRPPAVNSYDTMIAALRAQGTDDVWHLEDDVILTSGWTGKAQWLARLRGSYVIQGFSNRAKDLTVGSRFEPGSSFTYNLCFFVPGSLARDMADYLEAWPSRYVTKPSREHPHPAQYDYAMADFLKASRLRYWLQVPSLVQHREGPSLIPHHPGARHQSKTFVP